MTNSLRDSRFGFASTYRWALVSALLVLLSAAARAAVPGALVDVHVSASRDAGTIPAGSIRVNVSATPALVRIAAAHGADLSAWSATVNLTPTDGMSVGEPTPVPRAGAVGEPTQTVADVQAAASITKPGVRTFGVRCRLFLSGELYQEYDQSVAVRVTDEQWTIVPLSAIYEGRPTFVMPAGHPMNPYKTETPVIFLNGGDGEGEGQ